MCETTKEKRQAPSRDRLVNLPNAGAEGTSSACPTAGGLVSCGPLPTHDPGRSVHVFTAASSPQAFVPSSRTAAPWMWAACLVLGADSVRAQEPEQAVAHRIEAAPVIDGVLDEAFWADIDPITGFLQREPVDGAPATERTEVRIAYTPRALYFGMTMYDRSPGQILGNILQRGGWIDKDDNIRIAIDTYLDRRNAYMFEIGALGAQDDALITDESVEDWNWDGIYTTEARITDDGWVLEVEIPFTTIRFDDTDAPVMGIAFFRSIRRKNEQVFWPHIGQEYRGGIRQASRYATLTGLEGVERARHVEVKPYGIVGASKVNDDPADRDVDWGVDVKAGITSNFTLDLTYNTDFAQVESDNVQINLTRFNLFFPEKREFFLERAGLFQFGAPRESEVFFSRKIGLQADVVGGGRVTGQVGPISIGALSMRTDDAVLDPAADAPTIIPAAWNSVVRMRGDVGQRTSVGGIFTSQETSEGYNRVAGGDLVARFWSSSSLFLWGADVRDSRNDDTDARTDALQAELILQNDRYLFEITRTIVGEAFAPALGFVQRPDQKRWGGQFSFRPRFEQSSWARQLFLTAGANRIEGIDGVEQSHLGLFTARLGLQSGDNAQVGVTERYEFLAAPARIAGRELDPGEYTFRTVSASFTPNRARALGVSLNVSAGSFWGGSRTEVGGGLVWIANRHLTIDSRASWNGVALPVPAGEFSTTLVSTRLEAALNRRLFAYALLQWDDVSRTLQSNVRVDWIHTPGSDLFVVFDTGYLTGPLQDPRDARWIRRTGILKLTYLRAF
jgi:hypothetical protein